MLFLFMFLICLICVALLLRLVEITLKLMAIPGGLTGLLVCLGIAALTAAYQTGHGTAGLTAAAAVVVGLCLDKCRHHLRIKIKKANKLKERENYRKAFFNPAAPSANLIYKF